MVDIAGPYSAPPQLSESALNDYRRLLADEDFRRDHPERYAALKQSVDGALSVTKQSLDKPPILPTPQQHHSEAFGVPHSPKPEDYDVDPRLLKLPPGHDPAELAAKASHLAAALQLPRYMAPIAVEAVTAGAVDPGQVQATVERLGHDYKKLLAAVDGLIGGRVANVAAKSLPANALVQLGLFAEHHARMIASRPK